MLASATRTSRELQRAGLRTVKSEQDLHVAVISSDGTVSFPSGASLSWIGA
jgi:hypothetical protein